MGKEIKNSRQNGQFYFELLVRKAAAQGGLSFQDVISQVPKNFQVLGGIVGSGPASLSAWGLPPF